MLFGEDGILNIAENARETTQIENVREKLEVAKGMAAIDGNGHIDPDHYFDIIEEEGIIWDKEKDVVPKGDGIYNVTTKEGYVFEIILGEDGDITIDYVGKENVTGPQIREIKVIETSSNSVKIEVVADNVEGATYTYSAKQEPLGEWEDKGTSSDNIYTIEGLTSETAYTIRVVVETSEGSTEEEIGVTIGELPTGIITFGDTTWSDEQASVTISTESSYTLQYQINGIEEGNWTEISNGSAVTGLELGQTLYARLWDGTNGGEHASVDIEDKTAPTVSIGTSNLTTNSVTLTVTASDNESGLAETNRYTYYLGNEQKASNNTASYNYTGLDDDTTYTLRVVVIDKAGNSIEKTTEIRTEKQIVTDGSFSSEEGVNTPNIGDNMQLVVFDSNTNTWVEDTTKEAYSYVDTSIPGNENKSEWANAKVTTQVNGQNVESYFVWIPRFAYKIVGTNNIDIKFIKGTGKETTDGTPCKYVSENPTAADYIVHPAFTDEEENGGWDSQLAGIWVGKYETARSDTNGSTQGTAYTLKVQPGVTSYRGASIENMYSYSLAYAPNLGSHMLKNSEWGAVAYLTESKYGRNGTDISISNSGELFYTGGGSENAYVTNTPQSSTGNVYGIYDLSGNAYEYVAAAYLNRSEIGTSNGSTKYATVYAGTNVNINYKYGDATYETSGWNGDYAQFVDSTYSFFTRGGAYIGGGVNGLSGIFQFNRQSRSQWQFHIIPIGYSIIICD